MCDYFHQSHSCLDHSFVCDKTSVANKYYYSTGHYEQKNKKTTGQIKFLAVTIKQWIKLVLQHSLRK